MPTMPACKSNLNPIAVLQASLFEVCPCPNTTPHAPYVGTQEQFALYCCASASPFEVCPETAAHNHTTVVVTHIPDFTEYIIEGGQGWTAAFVSFNVI